MFDETRKSALKIEHTPFLPGSVLKILKNKRVLDIGCGNGWLTKYISRKNYVGVSYSVSEKDNLKKKGFECVLLDIEKQPLPFGNSSFDCVFASHILEHLEKHKLVEVMSEIKRVLKKGGVLIIITPTEFGLGFYGEWTHVRPYNHDSLKGVLKDFGYKNVDWCYPFIYKLPKWFQRLGRFPFMFLRIFPGYNPWREVIAYGFRKE